MHIDCFDMINPFVIASSPATRGADNVIRSSSCHPGAVTMRNFGHGMGGGGFFYPDFECEEGPSGIPFTCSGIPVPGQNILTRRILGGSEKGEEGDVSGDETLGIGGPLS